MHNILQRTVGQDCPIRTINTLDNSDGTPNPLNDMYIIANPMILSSSIKIQQKSPYFKAFSSNFLFNFQRNLSEARAARDFLPHPPSRAARANPPSEARRCLQNRFAPCCKDTQESDFLQICRFQGGRRKAPPTDSGGFRALRARSGKGSIRRFFGRMIFKKTIKETI